MNAPQGRLTLTPKQWKNVRQQNMFPMDIQLSFPPGGELHLHINPPLGYLSANTGIT